VFAAELIWLMASEAVGFMLAFPDLGCDGFFTRADCERMTSPYDPTQDACFWDATVYPQCAYYEPDPDNAYTTQRFMLIIVAYAVIRPPIMLMDHLIVNVLFAEAKLEYEYDDVSRHDLS
jgi:hypothetical protein